MPAKKLKPDEKSQSERFIEAAREAEADETEEGFERAFKKVIHPSKPPHDQDRPEEPNCS